MGVLGIAESVRFLTNQIGCESFAFSNIPTYRNLTLEFLSSFRYNPNYETLIHSGLVTFRLFGTTYRLTHRQVADLLGVPSGQDAFTAIQNDTFIDSELEYY
jgi:hypothetical protein